jgi:hypothetical protein
MAALIAQKYQVDPLVAPAIAPGLEFLLIRDGLKDSDFVERVRKQLPFSELTPAGLIIGLPHDRDIEEFHPPGGGHGHTVRLSTRNVVTKCDPWAKKLPAALLTEEEKEILGGLNADRVRGHWLPLIGRAPLSLDAAPTIRSRATEHNDNPLVVKHLCAEFGRILGNSKELPFPYGRRERSNVEADITGATLPDDVVIIGAHLDSTAMLTQGWSVHSGSAPGGDDDASGVAGVLAAAEMLAEMSDRRRPKRTIRFVLFNAEENRIAGSEVYVDTLLKRQRICVTAMIQMDMIGYVMDPGLPRRRYQVHAPAPENFPGGIKAVVERSELIREAVINAGSQVSSNLDPRRYPLEDCKDPAIERSDQYRFLLKNWPAVEVCEDLFVDECVDGNAQRPHPGYHKDTDTEVCAEYIADIARAVAGAAWMIAEG